MRVFPSLDAVKAYILEEREKARKAIKKLDEQSGPGKMRRTKERSWQAGARFAYMDALDALKEIDP